MEFVEKSINNIEKQYINKKNKNRLILLLNKYYLGFLTMNKTEYLNKGYNCCEEYLSKNKSDFDMLIFILFFSICIEDKEKIDYFNNLISKYKKYLKNNDEKNYIFYLFLQGLIKVNKGSLRGVNKYIKALQNIDNNICILCITFLKIKIDSIDREVISYIKTINKNVFWKNLILYNIFEKSSKFINMDKDIYKSYIKWALLNKIDIEKSIFKYENSIDIKIEENWFNQSLYKQYNQDFILSKICKAYLENNISNRYSYFFFKEAINRQISINGLNNSYIKACYKNNMEEIGLYPMRQFLKEPNSHIEIMSFVYYIILRDKKYNNLVLENKDKILKYGSYFLEKGCKGRYYYQIYKYMLDFTEEGSLEEKKIMDFLYPNNFLYEIFVEDDNADVILIKDYEINNVKEYKIKENKSFINASSTNFFYYIFSKDKKDIIKSNIKINKVIEGTNGKYFNRFYKRGYKDKFTLINSVKYYLEYVDLDNNKMELLKNVLTLDDISLDFKMKVILNLGNISFYKKDYETAKAYYKKVLEKYINDKYINNIVTAYINCKEYEKAIDIIKKKAHILDDNTLFYAIKNISEEERYDKDIAIFAYELLLKSKIDNLFIDIVLKHYKGGLKEWVELRKTLENIGVLKKDIDEHILRLTIYTNSINPYIEKVFVKIYEEDIENKVIEYFLNYCMYVSFNGDYIFSDDILYIMEYIFKETNDKIIGYALGHIYLKGYYKLDTKQDILKNIINNMKQDNINFKIFENNKDKFIDFAYLYKNKPFIYKAPPDREVYLHYKNINQDKFYVLKMNYFKFGMHISTVPVFYGEDIEYYFVENMENGSISTKKFFTTNNKNVVFDIQDEYFDINNAYLYICEGKYDTAHKVIQKLILKDYNLKGKLL